MDTYSVLSNLAVLISALLGVAVTLWPPTPNNKQKIGLMLAFLVLGVLAIVFQHLKAKNDKRETDEITARTQTVQQEFLFWQRGDPEPELSPYIHAAVERKSDGASVIKFYLQNPSSYPVYDMTLRVWDNVKQRNTEEMRYLVEKTVPYISPTSAMQLENGNIEIGPTETAKSFAVQFSCRTGEFRQNIAARKGDYGTWVFATQMRRKVGPDVREVIFRRVDSSFPSEAVGDIDWWMNP